MTQQTMRYYSNPINFSDVIVYLLKVILSSQKNIITKFNNPDQKSKRISFM